MKNIHIPEPCNENFNLMPPTERGAYCAKCSTDTFDFKGKSTDEIRQILKANLGKKVCGQITSTQLNALNQEFEQWTFTSTKSFQSGFLFALIAVFGLSLFSCSDNKQEADLLDFQNTTKAIVEQYDPSNYATVQEATSVQALEEEIPQIEYVDYVTGGVMEYDFIGQVYEEPMVRVEPEIYEVYGGAVAYTYDYIDYVKETVQDEYDENGNLIPKEFSGIAFPNPTSGNATLELKIPTTEQFKIAVYDMNGKLHQELFEGEITRGTFRQGFDLTDLTPGIYLVTIISKNTKEIIRVSKI